MDTGFPNHRRELAPEDVVFGGLVELPVISLSYSEDAWPEYIQLPNDWIDSVRRTVSEAPDVFSNWSANLQKAFLWTSAIQYVFNSHDLWNTIPRFSQAAFGFVFIDKQPWRLGATAFSDDLRFLNEPQHREITIGTQRFPLSVRYSGRRLHGNYGVDPQWGLTSCVANNSSNTTCFLSAYHVINDTSNPGKVALRPRGIGAILDAPTGTVDAGTFHDPNYIVPLSGLTLFKPRSYLAPGETVSFIDQYGATITTQIVSVTDTRGSMVPQVQSLFYMRDAGAPGDSGALVLDANGVGIGIYLGRIGAYTLQTEGYAQNLAQVTSCLQLALYQ